MRKLFIIVGLLGLGIGLNADDLNCADVPQGSSLGEWEHWRDQQIKYLLTPLEHEEGKSIEILGVADRALCLKQKLEHSADANRPEIRSLLQNFVRFINAVSWQSLANHEMGFPIADLEYLTEVREQIALPPLLRSEKFLQAISHPHTYEVAQKLVDDQNAALNDQQKWVSIFYQSRFIETPDQTTHGRFLVWIPGPPEQWIQFGILTPEMDQEIETHGVSIVSLWKDEKNLKRVAVVDYWRSYAEGEVLLQTKVEAGEGGANCFNCHKTGVLPIYPHKTFALNEQGELVSDPSVGGVLHKLNSRIKEHQVVHYGFGFDEGAFGPSVGPSVAGRSIQQIKEHIAPLELEERSLTKVMKAMDCTQCHDGEEVGLINFPTALISDQDQVDLLHPETYESIPLIREYLERGWMPKRASLTVREGQALYRALMKEYHDLDTGTGVLVEWLKGISVEEQ